MRKERQRSPAPDDLPPIERSDERSSYSDPTKEGTQEAPRHLTNDRASGRVNGLSMRGRVNGLVNGFTNGRINGLRTGRINGLINGFTNGRVNGLRSGRINGLINGFTNGRINGLKEDKRNKYSGLVNGLEHKTGLVNGNSFINGFRMPGARRRMPLSKKNSSIRLAIVLAIVAIVIITPFLLIFSMPESTIKIDGYFFDWERAGYFQEMKATSAAADVDIREYSTVVGQGVLYGYISTAGNMFSRGNGEPSALYGFFDMDNNPMTGYTVDGIGADKMIEIMGWNGTMKSATVSDFLVGFENADFSGFVSRGSIEAIPADNRIEFSFHTSGTQNPATVFMSKDIHGQEDESQYTVRFGEPALRVTAELVMPDVIPVDSREKVMDIGFESARGNFTITSLTFEKLGSSSQYRISVFDDLQVLGYSNRTTLTFEPALEIEEGYGRVLSVYVEMDGTQVFSSFGLSLNATGIGTISGPVTVDEAQVSNKVAYVGEIPHSIVIDGAFADWRYGYIMIDNANDVRLANGSLINDESIDITGYGMYIDQKDVAMYLSVADRICNGTSLPKNITIPVPTSGLPSPAEQRQLIGADIAGAVLDTDLNPSTGASFSSTLGADYLVLISGKKGRIIQSELYAWDASQGNGTWKFVEKVRSSVDSKRMELAFNFSALSMSDLDVAAVSFFMTDWKLATDFSDGVLPLAKWQIGTYSRAFGGILINEVLNNKGSLDWMEFYNTGTDPITLTGWRIYDGSNLLYTFGAITIAPGDLFVVYNLGILKNGDIRLVDGSGLVIDSVTDKESSTTKSYSRIGSPPYSTWRNVIATPGVINAGQVPIPEFSDILIPMLGIIGIFAFMRIRRRRAKDG